MCEQIRPFFSAFAVCTLSCTAPIFMDCQGITDMKWQINAHEWGKGNILVLFLLHLITHANPQGHTINLYMPMEHTCMAHTARTRTHGYTCTHSHAHTCMDTPTRACTYARIRAHARAHTHLHMQIIFCRSGQFCCMGPIGWSHKNEISLMHNNMTLLPLVYKQILFSRCSQRNSTFIIYLSGASDKLFHDIASISLLMLSVWA